MTERAPQIIRQSASKKIRQSELLLLVVKIKENPACKSRTVLSHQQQRCIQSMLH